MPPQKPVINLPTSSMALLLASTNKSQPIIKGMDTEISVHFLPINLNAAAENEFLYPISCVVFKAYLQTMVLWQLLS